MNEQDEKKIERRDFLIRSAKAGMSIALAGGLGYLLYDQGPKPEYGNKELTTLPDFRVQPLTGKTMSIIRTSDRINGLNKAIELLGGMSRFIKTGDTVAIKPNVGFASSPQLGATSNPELLAELVKLCFKAGAKRVIVADNPINAPESCFLLSGIEKAAVSSGAEVMLPRSHYFKPVSLKNSKLIRDWPVFFEPLKNADKLIGIAPVKSHQRSGASMAMKNWYGLLGGRRNIFHQDINGIISDLSIMIKPTLVILDGLDVMITNGPTGGSLSDLRKRNILIASCDQVAADSFGCTLLGLKSNELPFIAMAEKAGAGISDYRSLNPVFL